MFDFVNAIVSGLLEFVFDLGLEYTRSRREKKILEAPLEKTRATVISKSFGKRVKFQLDDGSTKRLRVSEEDYNWLQENMMGELAYKHTLFVDFTVF